MLVACEGGPSSSRLEAFPPRLEVVEADGLYVLVDDGPRESWRYVFVPRTSDPALLTAWLIGATC